MRPAQWRCCASMPDSSSGVPPSMEDRLNAFDAYLDSLESSDEEINLSPREKRKAALDREKEHRRRVFEEKLAVLTSLPEDLVVEEVATKCPGCGCKLQSSNESTPGYLPIDVLEERTRVLLESKQKAQSAQSSKGEVDQGGLDTGKSPNSKEITDANLAAKAGIDVSQIAEFRDILADEGIDLEDLRSSSRSLHDSVDSASAETKADQTPVLTAAEVAAAKRKKDFVVCQRCFRLSNYGVIEPELRVESPRKIFESHRAGSASRAQPDAQKSMTHNISREAKRLLTPATFQQNLQKIRSRPAVVVYLVDVFDFHGTFLSGLRDLIGERSPVIMAVNKVDLLPSDYHKDRVERWVRHEANSLGVTDLQAVHLISSIRGTGVRALLADALTIAKKRRADIYVVGAANVGKSSFINYVMANKTCRGAGRRQSNNVRERRAKLYRGKQNGVSLTTSVIPGTTLDVIRIPLGKAVSLYDTPGIIMSHQLTNSLNAEELRRVLPARSVEKVTLRLGEGKALFLGALARIEVVEGKPFFFSAFVSSGIKVHAGRAENADDFTARHVGDLLFPPLSKERLEELGEWSSKTFTAEGEGWKRAALDIVLSGLGWVAVTGVGSIRLKVCAPKGVGVFTRDALMPFELATTGAAKYTGSYAVNTREAKKSARKRKERRYSLEDADYF